LRLDEPVDRLLPELADRQVLRRIDSPLDDTVPADRPIILRDVLTFRLGYGLIMAMPDTLPIQALEREIGLTPGPPQPAAAPPPGEWLSNLARMPLQHQPGESWRYNLGSDILGVLIARAADQPLDQFLNDRIFAPLGMVDTGFFVPADKIDRLATSYQPDLGTGELSVYDDAVGGQWSRPPAFPSGGGGLVSTVDDLLRFAQMLLNGGELSGARIISRPSVELMTMNHCAPEQLAGSEIFLGENRGWGFGMSIVTRRDDLASIGTYGWDGGLGTTWYVDPREELVTILLTQVTWISPACPQIVADFRTLAHAAIAD
jgi:CubicO group peptidase (beta-lactamase class C family)